MFVSSTCKDMEAYRRAVEDAITNKAQTACFLSEDWTGGFDDVVQKCKDRVNGSFGFFLLLGYYYGWIPPAQAVSITHLEFQWAFRRWNRLAYPPMAVFAPKQGSDAETELRAEAGKYIPADSTERDLHAKRLESFRNEVLGAGRTAQFYANRQELRENAIVACLLWKGLTPLAAATGASGSTQGRHIDDELLGSLGRRPQLRALEDAVDAWYAEDEPAMAVLVHGDEDAGQRVFLAHTARTKQLDSFRPSVPGHPPMDPYDPPVLTQWIARALGLTGASAEVTTPEQLADPVAAQLREQPLCCMLDRVQGYPGGLSGFITGFWQPFRRRLLAIHQERALASRLILFVADYTGDLAGSEGLVADYDANPLDCARAVALPRLENFTARDVTQWLNQVNTPDRPAGRRAQIAASVVKNAAGIAEGKPLRVYEQLRSIDTFQDSDS